MATKSGSRGTKAKSTSKPKRTFQDKAREMSSEGINVRRADGTLKYSSGR